MALFAPMPIHSSPQCELPQGFAGFGNWRFLRGSQNGLTLNLRKVAAKPRVTTVCGGACDASPLSCFLFRPRKSREKRRKRSHINASNASVTRTSTPPAQTAHVRFRGRKRVHTPPQPLIAHTAAYTAKQVAFWVGVVSLPSERSARSQTSPGRVSEWRTLPLLSLGRGGSQRTQRASGQRCAYARRCPEASRPRWAAQTDTAR